MKEYRAIDSLYVYVSRLPYGWVDAKSQSYNSHQFLLQDSSSFLIRVLRSIFTKGELYVRKTCMYCIFFKDAKASMKWTINSFKINLNQNFIYLLSYSLLVPPIYEDRGGIWKPETKPGLKTLPETNILWLLSRSPSHRYLVTFPTNFCPLTKNNFRCKK